MASQSLRQLKSFVADREKSKQYIKWLMHYTSPFKFRIGGMMAVRLFMTYISIYAALISRQLVDTASQGKTEATVYLIFAGVMIAQLVIQVCLDLASAMINEKYSFGIRKQVYDKLLCSVWIGTQRFHTGDMMTRMTSDAGNIANGMVNVIPDIIILLVQLVSVFVTLFYFSPVLAISALFLTPIGVVLSWVLGRILKRYQVKVQETETAYRSFIQESLANLLVVKAFNGEEHFSERLTELRENRFYWVWKKNKLGAATSFVMNGTFSLGYMLAFLYAATQIAKGNITYGTLTLFITLFSRIQSPIVALVSKFSGAVSILASAGRVMEIQAIPLEERREIAEMSGAVGVEISDLSFAYDRALIGAGSKKTEIENTSNDVLSHVSLKINPGEFVAVMGKSGIGKTTLVRILLYFLQTDRGNIVYRDINGHEAHVNGAVRSFISYVPQGNTLFSGTIRENLLLGKGDATEEEMEEALRIADCLDFLKDLPDGLETRVGEKGVGLSEGQAQRLAIARAVIRKSPFIILDESTSALDEDTEKQVMQGICALNPRPTCLLVTHRKSVLNYCDREIVISNKSITE
ncbi:ABC-type multidrug transport system, ATPase and permease component [Lachnospiraceae bacterium]|nr:ABC-type multidrug transport system, ATPase and permease component [Lachnospiraceae bacterium]